MENLDEGELRKMSKALHKQAEGIEAKVEAKRAKKKARDSGVKTPASGQASKLSPPDKSPVVSIENERLQRKPKP